ncbi:MAG TPA: glycosyltransferase [Candidatus Acidoferrum sp.]|nr:glycosyltransferase [Candidatus Acidoferrum sp.]
MKLLLGIPSAGAPTQPFLESLTRMALPTSASVVERVTVTGNFVPAQRDLIVERALALNSDVLLMCDDDMVLAPNAWVDLCGLLEAEPRAALVGALYYSRDGFRPMVVDRWDENDTRSAVIPAFDREPVAVDGIGFGCVAIRVSALRDLAPPYFPAHVFVERGAARVRVCDEDYLFCARLRQAGYRVLLHPGVRCGHYDRASQTIAPRSWEAPEITRHERMAALVDGHPALVETREAAMSTPESRVRANVDYVVVP